MKLPPPPYSEIRAATDFHAFKRVADSYFDEVDPSEVLRSITYEDVSQGIWRPFGFRVVLASKRDLRPDERLVRAHLWPGLTDVDLPNIRQHPHLHGADLGGLVVHGEYEEQPVDLVPTNYGTDLQQVSIRSGDGWTPITLAKRIDLPVKTYKQGERHYMSALRFHKTVPKPRRFLATVVLLGNVRCPEGIVHPIGDPSEAIFDADVPPEQGVDEIWAQLQEAAV